MVQKINNDIFLSLIVMITFMETLTCHHDFSSIQLLDRCKLNSIKILLIHLLFHLTSGLSFKFCWWVSFCFLYQSFCLQVQALGIIFSAIFTLFRSFLFFSYGDNMWLWWFGRVPDSLTAHERRKLWNECMREWDEIWLKMTQNEGEWSVEWWDNQMRQGIEVKRCTN